MRNDALSTGLVLLLAWCLSSVGAAGADTTYGWLSLDLNASRAAKKPIILYIYDSAVKPTNTRAATIEKNVFPDAKVKDALSGFTYVMLRRDGKGWPAEYFARADASAALFVMTCDGTSFGAWGKEAQPTTAQLVAAAKQATAANAAAADRISKNPPPKFEEKPKVAAAKEAPAPVEKPPEKITVPGLGADAPKKTEAVNSEKKSRVEDE